MQSTMGVQHEVEEDNSVSGSWSCRYSSQGNDSYWLGYRIQYVEDSPKARKIADGTAIGRQGGDEIVYVKYKDRSKQS